MARTFQVKRGAKANMPTLAQGEFGFVTDSGAEELYIGNGEENIQIFSESSPPTAEDVGAMGYYRSLDQLGLTTGEETIGSIIDAMPNDSVLLLDVNTTSVESGGGGHNANAYPATFGLLRVTKLSNNRAEIDFVDMASSPNLFYKKSYRAGIESDWAKQYSSLNTPTAAEVGAVRNTGDIVTGNLIVRKANDPGFVAHNETTDRSATMYHNGDKSVFTNTAFNDVNNRTMMLLQKETGSVQNLLQLQTITEGAEDGVYTVLHTGNKELIVTTDIGAVNKSGDIMNSGALLRFISSEKVGGGLQAYTDGLRISSYADANEPSSTYRGIQLYPPTKADDDDAFKMVSKDAEGNVKWETFYHTGNLPQSDWNQNDASAPDYIKNRPFYTSDPIETVYADNVTVEITSDGVAVNPFPLEFIDGCEYSVIWNGTEYRTICSPLDNGLAIGNRAYVDQTPDTSEPFLILVDHDGYVIVFGAANSSVTVSVVEMAVDVTKIDAKYLPTMVGEDVTGREFTKQGQTLVAEEGAEIFNDYKHNIASGEYSHAEGSYTTASGTNAHAEGFYTTASGTHSHAEGFDTSSTARSAHAEGRGSEATGQESHAEGYYTKASGYYAHAEGSYTTASGDGSHVQGQYNIDDPDGVYQHIIGNGGPSKRSNAHTVDWDGNAWFAGDVYVGSTSGVNRDDGSKKLATVDELNALTAADVGAVRVYTSLAELGLTESTVTMNDILAKMSVPSKLLVYSTNSWASGVVPETNGTLVVDKIHQARVSVTFTGTSAASNRYVGTATTTNTFGGWKKLYHEGNKPTAADVGAVNPNLLDNCYFVDPVNQRGQTEYSGVAYTIDRWKIATSNTTVTCDNAVLSIHSPTDSYGAIRQDIGLSNLDNTIVTISMLLDDGTLCTDTGNTKDVTASTTTVLALADGSSSGRYAALFRNGTTNLFRVQLKVPTGAEMKVVAVKLELGSVQTLAHQDADGKWVLNEIPNKSEELLKCCMSTADSTDAYANNKMTANAVEAVAKSGGIMNSGALLRFISSQGQGGGLQAYTDGLRISSYADANEPSSTYRGLQLYPPTKADDAGALKLVSKDTEGNVKWETFYHTGNKPTAADVGAVALDGRNAMTGALAVNGNYANVNGNANRAQLRFHPDPSDLTKAYSISLYGSDDLNSIARIYSIDNGVEKQYNILHTGNVASYAATSATYTATVTTTWTTSGNYFYQDITVSGILATDNPIVDINPGSDNALNITYSDCMCKVFRITTSANTIRVWATEAISTAFPIQLKVVR